MFLVYEILLVVVVFEYVHVNLEMRSIGVYVCGHKDVRKEKQVDAGVRPNSSIKKMMYIGTEDN